MKHDIVFGRAVDLKDSMENKMEGLEIQIRKWEHRVSHFLQREAAKGLSPIKEKIKKIGKNTKSKVGKIKGGWKIINKAITAEKI